MSWSEILNQIQSGSMGNELLIGVHPSYGEQMVSRTIWEAYQQCFMEIWANHVGPRVLIPNNRNVDCYLAADPDFEISEFPSGLSQIRLPLIKVAGATAKRIRVEPNGCVDNVVDGFVRGNYADRIAVLSNAVLYP